MVLLDELVAKLTPERLHQGRFIRNDGTGTGSFYLRLTDKYGVKVIYSERHNKLPTELANYDFEVGSKLYPICQNSSNIRVPEMVGVAELWHPDSLINPGNLYPYFAVGVFMENVQGKPIYEFAGEEMSRIMELDGQALDLFFRHGWILTDHLLKISATYDPDGTTLWYYDMGQFTKVNPKDFPSGTTAAKASIIHLKKSS